MRSTIELYGLWLEDQSLNLLNTQDTKTEKQKTTGRQAGRQPLLFYKNKSQMSIMNLLKTECGKVGRVKICP